jgi:hypothetical protein
MGGVLHFWVGSWYTITETFAQILYKIRQNIFTNTKHVDKSNQCTENEGVQIFEFAVNQSVYLGYFLENEEF